MSPASEGLAEKASGAGAASAVEWGIWTSGVKGGNIARPAAFWHRHPNHNGAILATVPDILEAVTFGKDRDDAPARAVDAIETAIMGAIAAREDVPAPRAAGAVYVTLPALSSAKIELFWAMVADGVGKAALAKRLGVASPRVDRLLDLKHSSRLDAIERAFSALGGSITIIVEAA